MPGIQDAVQPMWKPESKSFPGTAERTLRDLSQTSLLVFAATAVAAGVLAFTFLSSELGIGTSWPFIVTAILVPLLCGGLARERWRVKKLADQIKGHVASHNDMAGILDRGDNTPAGLLIVSPDLRVQFANQRYLDNSLREPEQVLGWKLQDLVSVEGVEDYAGALLLHSTPAASCCFSGFIRVGFAGERPMHITMARIAPRQGEDRILVVVEDVVKGDSFQLQQPVAGYVC